MFQITSLSGAQKDMIASELRTSSPRPVVATPESLYIFSAFAILFRRCELQKTWSARIVRQHNDAMPQNTGIRRGGTALSVRSDGTGTRRFSKSLESPDDQSALDSPRGTGDLFIAFADLRRGPAASDEVASFPRHVTDVTRGSDLHIPVMHGGKQTSHMGPA